MKANKLILPLVIALGAMLATTGCKHGPTGLTKLPGARAGATSDQNPDLTSRPGIIDNTDVHATPNRNGDPSIPLTPINLADYDQDRTIFASDTVHFQYDSAVVQDKEQIKLAAVAQGLANDPSAKLLIEGHCDERGTEEYNRALGDRRAGSLREALVHNGVDASRVTTISYGKDRPVDKGHSEAAHSKNRRGEFIALHHK